MVQALCGNPIQFILVFMVVNANISFVKGWPFSLGNIFCFHVRKLWVIFFFVTHTTFSRSCFKYIPNYTLTVAGISLYRACRDYLRKNRTRER